jgi:GxxExxY protein
MHANEREFPAWDVARSVIGVFYEVYNELGPGFLESVYQDAMGLALQQAGLSVARQVAVDVVFRGLCVGTFRADLLIAGELLVELKAARTIDQAHLAQVLNYLRATRLEAGLLLNFGPRPQFKRVVYSHGRKAVASA